MVDQELRYLSTDATKKLEISKKVEDLVGRILEVTPKEEAQNTFCYIEKCFENFYKDVEEDQIDFFKTEEQLYNDAVNKAISQMNFLNEDSAVYSMTVALIYINHDAIMKGQDLSKWQIAQKIATDCNVDVVNAYEFVRETYEELNEWLYNKGFYRWPRFTNGGTPTFLEEYLQSQVEFLIQEQNEAINIVRAQRVAKQQAEALKEEIQLNELENF